MKTALLCYLLSALVIQAYAVCDHRRVCVAARDTIVHSDVVVDETEKASNTHRSWKIQPATTRGNILLAFKNFETAESAIVEVNIAHFGGEVETKFYSGNLGNFETIAKNAWYIALNVSLGIGTINFTLDYYADCEVSRDNPIQSFADDEGLKKCFIVIPDVEGYINRVYVTMRRIQLPEGMIMKVQDIHTSSIVATIKGETYLEPVATQAPVMTGGINSYFILVDFICERDVCDYSNKQYTISYYAMREKDIWCIEVLKMCNSNSNFPMAWCNVQCPALTAMVEQEFILEERELVAPDEEFEQEEDTRVLKKTNHCPPRVHRRFCQCPAGFQFNNLCEKVTQKKKCIEYGPCAWECIVQKVTQCIRIKVLKAYRLF